MYLHIKIQTRVGVWWQLRSQYKQNVKVIGLQSVSSLDDSLLRRTFASCWENMPGYLTARNMQNCTSSLTHEQQWGWGSQLTTQYEHNMKRTPQFRMISRPFPCCRDVLVCELRRTVDCNLMCFNNLEHTNHPTNLQLPQHHLPSWHRSRHRDCDRCTSCV